LIRRGQLLCGVITSDRRRFDLDGARGLRRKSVM
jgi:hypothetical protein